MLTGLSGSSTFAEMAAALKNQKANAASYTAETDTSGTTSSSATTTITANDFLTLLVTELKNQDPTAQTDPNEYVNQLVNINSLEQLVAIDQNTTPSTSTTSKASAIQADGGASSVAAQAAASSVSPGGNLSAASGTAGTSRLTTALEQRRTGAV